MKKGNRGRRRASGEWQANKTKQETKGVHLKF